MAVLAQIEERRDFEIWEKQYRGAARLLNRYQAIRCLRQTGLKAKKKLLVDITEDPEEHFAIRAEALEQLTTAGHGALYHLYKQAFESADVQYQKEAVAMVPRELQCRTAVFHSKTAQRPQL
ncbi:MAG: hypothetical protein U5L96_12630 [Owenweeksia sp.]|nr:hypothetical protein [Owenweeksia sp.]